MIIKLWQGACFLFWGALYLLWQGVGWAFALDED